MKEKNEFPIEIAMITYIIILVMYIFTYSQGLKLFWGFFIIERLIGMHYDEEIDRYFFKLEEEDVSGGKMILTIIFSLLSVGIFLYTPFKYPGLFGIIIIGEVLDFIIREIKRRIKLK